MKKTKKFLEKKAFEGLKIKVLEEIRLELKSCTTWRGKKRKEGIELIRLLISNALSHNFKFTTIEDDFFEDYSCTNEDFAFTIRKYERGRGLVLIFNQDGDFTYWLNEDFFVNKAGQTHFDDRKFDEEILKSKEIVSFIHRREEKITCLFDEMEKNCKILKEFTDVEHETIIEVLKSILEGDRKKC